VRKLTWQQRFAILLLAIALALYAVRWFAFPGEALHSEMWRFLIGDIAFVFVQVLMVTLVIDGLIRRREREEMRRKLNMVIGAFFSETGTLLLDKVVRADTTISTIRDDLVPSGSWDPARYAAARAAFRLHKPTIELSGRDLVELRDTLAQERSFMIGLLANQTLLEHESFSDLLWALTHLGEELSARTDVAALTPGDARHIAIDIKRAYTLLVVEWLSYMQHLQHTYPYLFSLAVRTNPFDPRAEVEVSE